MKYNDTNKPIVCMQTNSTCYKGTEEMTILGVLWHSTGANNPNISRYVQPTEGCTNYSNLINVIGKNKYNNDWNHIERQAGLNAWIGKLANGTVATVQTMPWNFRPWGCGKGPKGSCNNGWIQFEICEDALTSKEYFEAVYKEAVELTAYLCKMFNLDPKGTAVLNGVKVPVILCHADSYKLGVGSNHGDVHHWFKKYGKTMDNVRADVAALLEVKKPTPAPTQTSELYRVRKSWEDHKSQIGAYKNLEYAKKACTNGYSVFDSKGNKVYPVSTPAPTPVAPKPTPAPTPVAPKPTPAPTPVAPKKSVDEVAKEVINGKWGNGADRKKRLEAAGYNYNEVQKKVNDLVNKKESSKPALKSIEVIAKEVIQGKWGNGADRKKRLEAAGYKFSDVQRKVNELLK